MNSLLFINPTRVLPTAYLFLVTYITSERDTELKLRIIVKVLLANLGLVRSSSASNSKSKEEKSK